MSQKPWRGRNFTLAAVVMGVERGGWDMDQHITKVVQPCSGHAHTLSFGVVMVNLSPSLYLSFWPWNT